MKAYTKSVLGLLTMFAAMSAEQDSFRHESPREYDPIDIKPAKKVIPAGCKEYTRYGITVVAISHERAMKKIGKILAKQNEKHR